MRHRRLAVNRWNGAGGNFDLTGKYTPEIPLQIHGKAGNNFGRTGLPDNFPGGGGTRKTRIRTNLRSRVRNTTGQRFPIREAGPKKRVCCGHETATVWPRGKERRGGGNGGSLTPRGENAGRHRDKMAEDRWRPGSGTSKGFWPARDFLALWKMKHGVSSKNDFGVHLRCKLEKSSSHFRNRKITFYKNGAGQQCFENLGIDATNAPSQKNPLCLCVNHFLEALKKLEIISKMINLHFSYCEAKISQMFANQNQKMQHKSKQPKHIEIARDGHGSNTTGAFRRY